MAALTSLEAPYDAVVIGASGGIGSAFCQLLAQDEGIGTVIALSRSGNGPEHRNITHSRIDLVSEESVKLVAARAAELPNLRLVIVATGLLHDGDEVQPEKALRKLDPDMMARSFAVNTIGPALVMKHFVPLLPRNGKAVLAAISARVGSISGNALGGWYSYRASKAALNMLLKTTAIELARTRKDQVILGLHPGTVDTGLSKPFQSNVADGKLFTPQQSAQYLLDVIDKAGPEASGSVIAWDGQTVPA
jgi:NAD(P)-dependent dehydrogenase (short-subunit alcohol dehydrogenase family)